MKQQVTLVGNPPFRSPIRATSRNKVFGGLGRAILPVRDLALFLSCPFWPSERQFRRHKPHLAPKRAFPGTRTIVGPQQSEYAEQCPLRHPKARWYRKEPLGASEGQLSRTLPVWAPHKGKFPEKRLMDPSSGRFLEATN